MASSNEEKKTGAPTVKGRIFSIATLCGVVSLIGYAGTGVYRIATDEFVAPCVLSPDSDLVIQSKLSMAQLVQERFRATTRSEEIDVNIEAADKTIAELEELKEAATRGMDFTTTISAQQASASGSDLQALAKQRTDLIAMVASQESFVTQVKSDLESGLATKADYSRANQALSQVKIALIENERARLSSEMTMNEATLTQQALKSHVKGHTATPEMLMHQEQLVRISSEILKLRSERRSTIAEKAHLAEELGMIDQLMSQLKERPTFTAADSNLTVAFVPYTQIDGVEKGAEIYDCIWGLFHCTAVGHVTKLLPGEVILPDPWGTMTRGQYATMDIDDPAAAKSRTLRVRPDHAALASLAPKTGARVANAK